MTAKLYYNVVGQELYFEPKEGRPSSVTSVSMFEADAADDGTAESSLGTAAVDTDPATTIDAESGISQSDPTVIRVADTAGFVVGRRYLVTSTTGERELFEVRSISSGASVEARHPLKNDYAAGSTVETTRITVSILDAWIQDSANLSDDTDPNPGYRVRWEYVYGGKTYVSATYCDVVRYRADHDVHPQRIAEVDSQWLADLPLEHQEDRGQRLIDRAYEKVKVDLHMQGIAAEMMRNRDVINELVEAKAIYMAYSDRAKRTGEIDGWEIARGEYQRILDGLVASGRTDQAVDDSGAGTKREAISLWER